MYKTEQENFWASSFGEEYVDRNISEEYVISSIRLFADIFKHCAKVQSIIEFGANIGLNIKAIRQLMPFSRISAIEINKKAVKMLSEIDRGGGKFSIVPY